MDFFKIYFHHISINIFLPCCCCLSVFVDLMLTVMEASNFTPSVYSVHALTLLAEVKPLCLCLWFTSTQHESSVIPVVYFSFQSCLNLSISVRPLRYTEVVCLSCSDVIYDSLPSSTSVVISAHVNHSVAEFKSSANSLHPGCHVEFHNADFGTDFLCVTVCRL